MVWFGIFLYLLVSSLKIRFCEQSVFVKSPLPEKTKYEIYKSHQLTLGTRFPALETHGNAGYQIGSW